MNKKLSIYIAFIGLLGLLASCEKDETKAVLLSNPVAPTIKTMPDLTLIRANGTDTVVIAGTPVNPGFVASANYFLEVDTAGNNFQNPLILANQTSDAAYKFSVSDLNSLLIKKFPTDTSSSVEFRIRSVLVIDAGTGYTPIVSISETKSAVITTYGLPRLDLIGSGLTQKIESPLGNGDYSGYVKLDPAKPFTLKDPDANVTYGATGNTLVVDGAGITVDAAGWYFVEANTQALTLSKTAYMIGLVGSATPNGWNSPDSKMDYNAKTGTWSITTNLIDGEIKFRLNDGWAWNLGGTPDNLTHNGANIAVSAGNYTITLTITNATAGSEAGTCTIVKNN